MAKLERRQTAEVLPLDTARERFGAPYYVIHRSDLHRLLAEASPASSLQLNKRCTQVEMLDRSVGLSFADGTSHEADLVIGSDGIRSTVRRAVFGGDGPRYSGYMCWRSLVPAEALPRGHQDGYVTNWGGANGFVVSYYVRQGAFVNIVAVRKNPDWTEEILVRSQYQRGARRCVSGGRPDRGRIAAASQAVQQMGPVHRRARAAMDQGPGHAAGRCRPRDACDVRPRRRHGVRGQLRPCQVARSPSL